MKNPFEEYPVIEFKDIRKGDTIAAIEKNNNVFKNGINSIVGRVDVSDNHGGKDTYWYTEGGMRQIASNSSYATYNEFRLIDRPKPELPTETGSVILIKQYDGVVLEEPLVSVLDMYGDWFVPKGDENKAVNVVWLVGKPERNKVQEWALVELKEVTA